MGRDRGRQGGRGRGGRVNPAKQRSLVELVDIVARALVDKPEDVEAVARGPRIELAVAGDDIGKVIGKEGRTAQSIRVLLSAAASKLGAGRAYLDILD